MSTPTPSLSRELIELACRAPSVHNTQPWAWRIVDAATIELYGDRARQLPALDPQGRDLAISCGAALHHLLVAAQGRGLAVEVSLTPEGSEVDQLARVHLSAGEKTAEATEMLGALENRTTDRRGFTDWPLPPDRLHHLVEAASGWGAHLVAINEPGPRARVEKLAEQAREVQLTDVRVSQEQDSWIDRGTLDGVPTGNALPDLRRGVRSWPDRFNAQRSSAQVSRTHEASAVILVYTARDDQKAWVQTGEALSALWIRANLDGLAITPNTQVIEVDTTRRLLRRDVLEDLGQPQLLVRVGWPEVSRPLLDRTPRRRVGDVLLP